MEKILFNQSRKNALAGEVYLCDSFWKRTQGLLGHAPLLPHQAFWLIPCNSVHTFGMKYPIDLYALNKDNRVVAVIKNMKPNRISRIFWKAHSILEMISGPSRDCEPGDQLEFQEAA